jgi:hypothetical protein
MKFIPFAFLLFTTGIVCSGQGIGPTVSNSGTPRFHSDAIQLQSTEWVVPELIIGGEWTSSIKFTNRGSVAIPPTNVYFWDNTGKPMMTTFQATNGQIITGTGFSFSLGVGAIVQGTFTGGASTAFGMATIACSALGCGTHGLYGEVTLRNHNAARPDFVVVFPLEMPSSGQYMLFDGTSTNVGPITTTLYVVNNSVSPATATMEVRDSNNNLVDSALFTFVGLGSQIQTLHVLCPGSIGVTGTLVFRVTSIDPLTGAPSLITATALRIDPSGSFAPVRAWIPGS